MVTKHDVCNSWLTNSHRIYYDSLARDKTHAEICLMIRNGTSDVVSHIARLLESGDGSAIPLPGLPGWEFVQSKPHPKLDQLGPESNILAKWVGTGHVWGVCGACVGLVWGLCGVCVASLCRGKLKQLGPGSTILSK